MSDNFLAEDYRFLAKLLRKYASGPRQETTLFNAVCSNNLNLILEALDEAAEVADLVEDFAKNYEAAVPPKSDATE